MKHEDALAFVRAASRAGDRAIAAARPEPVNFAGAWKNELGSTMTLTVTGSKVTGTYESQVSGGGGPVVGELQGWVNGAVISFVVNWTNSTTAWVGHHVQEGRAEAIETLWELAVRLQNPEDSTDLWESVLAGADRFVRA